MPPELYRFIHFGTPIFFGKMLPKLTKPLQLSPSIYFWTKPKRASHVNHFLRAFYVLKTKLQQK